MSTLSRSRTIIGTLDVLAVLLGVQPSFGQNTGQTATATAAAQNVAISGTASFSVSQGTTQVRLTYNVFTVEYPYYVLSQSIYNDTWSVIVQGGASGQQLFSISRQINTQLQVDPVWQVNGSTGDVVADIDVSALTSAGPADLILVVSAMNVGDSALPTIVTAKLGGLSAVTINNVTADVVSPTQGDSSYYSIPRPPASNTYQRTFDLNVTKPSTATIQNMRVILLGPGALQTVVDEGIGDNVTEISPTLLRVRVTYPAGNSSSVPSQPPPAHDLKYRFRVTVSDGGVESFGEKDSGVRHALWRMPDGFARYSTRDTGGDDWASKAAFEWLDANGSLITRINDISGEHARNIGHKSHKRGTDIDMFHFYTFPGAVSGGDNYAKLRSDVLLGATTSTDPAQQALINAARARIDAWIGASRTGIDNLSANASVNNVLYAKGAAGAGLPNGWAVDLLTSGSTTVNGTPYLTGAPSWSNAKYIARNDHNDHLHVSLAVQ
jgi:hypothetical protein